VIDKAGFGHAFIHGIGHQLGLEVHDVTPTGPLKPGMVVTIEPGVYLPEQKLGIRIEDDILVTAKGNQNLTTAVPKTVKDIESAMAVPF
jgi:Xaa-Pro aminopeptidase